MYFGRPWCHGNNCFLHLLKIADLQAHSAAAGGGRACVLHVLSAHISHRQIKGSRAHRGLVCLNTIIYNLYISYIWMSWWSSPFFVPWANTSLLAPLEVNYRQMVCCSTYALWITLHGQSLRLVQEISDRQHNWFLCLTIKDHKHFLLIIN